MNRKIALTGSAIVSVTVLLFALCMVFRFDFGSYLVCMILLLGYIITAAGFRN